MGGIGPISGSIASAEQQYALRWNDFHSSILSSFRHLRDEEDFIDVTIACDGCSFTAHKVVLSACSPFFRSLLKANPCQHPIVILRDVREQDMEALLRFMYNGEVHIGQEQMSDFLKTAQTLQVRGLADVSTKDSGKSSTTTATSGITNNIPWDVDGTHNTSNNNNLDTQGPPLKKSRTTDHHHNNSRYADTSPHRNASNDNDAQGQHTLNDASLTLSHTDRSHSTSNQVKGLDGPIQLHSSNDDDSNSFDDEASDAECTDRGGSSIDLMQPKLEHSDYSYSDRSRNDSILSPMFDPQRQRTGYASGLFNLQGIAAGLIPGPSGLHNNSQDAYGKVRATDPRPCPKCGKIYRSAHTLRTHLEDKHTVCSGYRCVLCGTVAKSRNSLHSHMSRQHRGISTKDLPVLPMPSSFDPELASKLYMKAGIKMSPAELRARASPTGTVTPLRRSDTRLDMSSGSNNISGEDDPQDLSINSNRYGLAPPSPLDFHRNSPNLSKLNSMASMIPLLGSDKENRAIPPTTAMFDAYFQLLADGNLVTPEQAAEMAKLAAQNKWPDYNNSGNNNGDNECSTSQDEDSFSEDETSKPIKASENY